MNTISILTWLLSSLGGNAVPAIEGFLIEEITSGNKPVLERWATIPDNLIEEACKKTGGDPTVAKAWRDEFAKTAAEFAAAFFPGAAAPVPSGAPAPVALGPITSGTTETDTTL